MAKEIDGILTSEHLVVPNSLTGSYTNLGAEPSVPVLSWNLGTHGEDCPGIRQRAWQIRASECLTTLTSGRSGDGAFPEVSVFDSGPIESDESINVRWPFEPLQSRQRIYWKLRVWVEGEGRPSAWSEPALLEVGLLDFKDWQAKWIAFGEDGRETSVPLPYLRKHFVLPSAPVRARLYAAALGLYELYLNGSHVHPEEVLVPGWSDFRHRAQYMTFDVTRLLRQGNNMLGAILADGWFGGYLGYKNHKSIYGEQPSLLGQLEVICQDGSRVVIVTDSSWEARTGPLLASDLYNGEHYDARLELDDWARPVESGGNLSDTDGDGSKICNRRLSQHASEAWGAAFEREWPDQLLLDAKIVEPPRRIQELPAKVMTQPREGVYIFDLGQNIAGWARLRLCGYRGQVVRLRFGEMLNADGSLYTANLRRAKVTDSYTFGKDGETVWEPRFTFHGFRYVELSGVGDVPAINAITGIAIYSDMQQTGSFNCSEAAVNQLWKNITWGLRGNFLDIPTDCPQRDERLGWSGDIQVFCRTASFLYNTEAFLTKWLRDLRDGQREDGAYPDIAPTFICGFGNAAWADAGVIVPWVIYRRFGNIAVLRENYDSMCRYIDFLENTSNELIRPRTAYGDWLAIDAVTPPGAPVPSDLIGTAYFAQDCSIMENVSRLLGDDGAAAHFRHLALRVREAFRREYVTAHGRIVGDCQTAYVISLAFDLLDKKDVGFALDQLVEQIRCRDWHLSTGFVGTPLLCKVLSRYGRHDVAMKLLLQDSYPSWLFTVKNGATTMWERWNSYTPDQGFGDPNMNSFNHYAYGAIGEWMVHWLAGIAPATDEPAYRKIIFRPQPSGFVTHASSQLQTPYGAASIRWENCVVAEREIFGMASGKSNEPECRTDRLLPATCIKGDVIVPDNCRAVFVSPLKNMRYFVTNSTGEVVPDGSCIGSGVYHFYTKLY